MATVKENEKFTVEAFCRFPLDNAIFWIQRHMEPDDVFEEEKLKNWATENGFVPEE